MKDISEVLNEAKNNRLLVVFPHPDDESVTTGGLIQRAIALGLEVKVVCLTRGGAGKSHIDLSGKSLQEVRTQEFESAMSILGVEEWEIWNFDDASLKTEDGWQKDVTELIEDFKPGLVVSYDLTGMTGHPDHISLSLELFSIAKKKKSFQLVFVGMEKGSFCHKFFNKKLQDILPKPNLSLKLTLGELKTKSKAMLAHKSQGLSKIWMWPLWLCAFWYRKEWFHLVDLKKEYEHRFVEFEI